MTLATTILRARAAFTDVLGKAGIIDPWPRFVPHPDAPQLCYICGEQRDLHGLLVEHCHPVVLADNGWTGEPSPKRPR